MTDTSLITPVLVTGASGNLGSEIVSRLHMRGVPVRRLDRHPVTDSRAGVETATGDLTDPAAVRAALDGVSAVFLIWPLLDASPARPVLTEIAAAATRVVYL